MDASKTNQAPEVFFLAAPDIATIVYAGSVPNSEPAFDTLADLGIRTIISVDGASPDLERATQHGMRYIHLPLGYGEIDENMRLVFAAAVRDMPGPIYIHCHRGVHRGPAAVAVALSTLGDLSTAQSLALLTRAGTSKDYPGLWRSVATSTPARASQLDAIDTDSLPAQARVGTFVEGMVSINNTYENLEAIADAGWKTPRSHPDLAPASEAGQLAELFRALSEHTTTPPRPAAFTEWMRSSTALAIALEQALTADDPEAASISYAALIQDCKACHAAYRN